MDSAFSPCLWNQSLEVAKILSWVSPLPRRALLEGMRGGPSTHSHAQEAGVLQNQASDHPQLPEMPGANALTRILARQIL